MKKTLRWLDNNLESSICMVLLTAFTILLFVQVVMRYVFNNSLSWSEELARYMFVWMVYLGVSYGAKQMKHLKIDAFLLVFPKRARPFIMIFADVLVIVFAVYVVLSAQTMVERIAKLGTKSTALGLPMKYVYAAPLVGFALTALRQVQAIIYHARQLKEGGEAA